MSEKDLFRFCRIALLCFALCVSLTACGGGGGGSNTTLASTSTPERLMLSGAGDLGIFDPSVTLDPGANRLWMSYSSVGTSIHYSSSVYWGVSIRLAFSDDNGSSWQDAGVVVAPRVDTDQLGPMGVTPPSPPIPALSKGIWQSETSTLIYDPGATNPAQRWKLIWFQYLHANQTSYFANHSWIAMKMAATPLELATAAPVKLFGGAGLRADGSNTAPPVFSPAGGIPAIQLNIDLTRTLGGANLADLNLCVFAEPDLHATNNALFLAIFCADASTTPITEYLVYFRCSSPCNMTTAANWEYLGRLLGPADALAATGDDHFQAPAIVAKNNKTYLLATPVDASIANRYNGCRVYEFVSVDSSQLRRSAGALVEIARVDGKADSHNGACTDFVGLDGGLLLSQFETGATPETFRIFKSQQLIP